MWSLRSYFVDVVVAVVEEVEYWVLLKVLIPDLQMLRDYALVLVQHE